jgi:hypothetical protein
MPGQIMMNGLWDLWCQITGWYFSPVDHGIWLDYIHEACISESRLTHWIHQLQRDLPLLVPHGILINQRRIDRFSTDGRSLPPKIILGNVLPVALVSSGTPPDVRQFSASQRLAMQNIWCLMTYLQETKKVMR